jgi:ADP-heptose:LPS heptosyltransferase
LEISRLPKETSNSFKNFLFKIGPRLGRKLCGDFPKNVVLVHLENLGDFILFSAVIRETRRNFPSSRLIVVGQKENAGVVKHCDLVDEWIWIKGHKRPKHGESTGKEKSYFSKLITTYLLLLFKFKGRIDFLIGPDWLLTKSYNQFTSNVLFKKANVDGGFASSRLIYNPKCYVDEAHQVTRNLSILKMLGLKVENDKTENWVLQKSEKSSVKSEALNIIISLGAGHLRRNYPVSKIAQVIKELNSKLDGSNFTLLGPRSLRLDELSRIFLDCPNTLNLIGKTNLEDAASLIRSADLVIVNDSGFAHLAASFEVPVLVVSAHPQNAEKWHLHSPNRYHPWKTSFVEIQPLYLLEPCVGSCLADSPHCIATVEVKEIVESAAMLLGKYSKD